MFKNEYWFKSNDFLVLKNHLEALEKECEYFKIDNRLYNKLYKGRESDWLGKNNINTIDGLYNCDYTYNIVRSVIDTLVSKIAANEVLPKILTENGNENDQKNGEKLNRFLYGQFNEIELLKMARKALLDSCIYGSGILKLSLIESEKDKYDFKLDRILKKDILISHIDSIYGKATEIHHRKFINREVLREMFPTKKDLIRSIPRANIDEIDNEYKNCDVIKIYESYKTKEKYCISSEKGTIFEQKYNRDYLPYVILNYTDPLEGIFSQGLGDILLPIQQKLDYYTSIYDESLRLTAIPKVFIDEITELNEDDLNNEVGGIVRFRGQAPIITNTQSASSQIYQQIETLYQRGYEISGVSQMTAQAKKPGGIVSGIAMREYSDIQTQRFFTLEKNYEQFILQIGNILLKETANLANEKKVNKIVKYNDGQFIEKISWKDIHLDDDSYSLSMGASNFLSKTPSSRYEQLMEMFNAQLINPNELMELLDAPDMQAFRKNKTVDKVYADYILEKIYSKEDYTIDNRANLEIVGDALRTAYLKESSKKEQDQEIIISLNDAIETINLMLLTPQSEMPTEVIPPENLILDQERMPADLQNVEQSLI